jgi:hypothetical protein
MKITRNKALHADAYCYARFVYFAALHFHTKRSPQYAQVSATLNGQDENRRN